MGRSHFNCFVFDEISLVDYKLETNVGIVSYKASTVESKNNIADIMTLTSDIVWPCVPRPLDCNP